MLNIYTNIHEYNDDEGIILDWENEFIIKTEIENNTIVLKLNKDGMISLAKHLLSLAQDNVPVGYHIHYDDLNSLEDNSCEMIIEKI